MGPEQEGVQGQVHPEGDVRLEEPVGGGGGVGESSEALFKEKVEDLILLLKWVDGCPYMDPLESGAVCQQSAILRP